MEGESSGVSGPPKAFWTLLDGLNLAWILVGGIVFFRQFTDGAINFIGRLVHP